MDCVAVLQYRKQAANAKEECSESEAYPGLRLRYPSTPWMYDTVAKVADTHPYS